MELHSVNVAQILAHKGRDIHTIRPSANVYEALEAMARHKVGALLVMEGDDLVGIFSERDYARKVALHGHNSRDALISEMMSAQVCTTHEQAELPSVMNAMTDGHFRHLPVLREGKVVGMITIGDVVKAVFTTAGIADAKRSTSESQSPI